jgi:hypothetical protein
MAFNGSSYFAGIGTAFAAIAVGFAGGAMITTSTVQPPNRLERVNASAGATTSSIASSGAEQASAAKPAPQEAPPSPVVAAAPSAPAADSQTAPQPQAAAPAAAKAAAKNDAASNVQEQPAPAAAAKNPAPAPVARSDDAAPAKSERTTVGRAPDPNSNRETPRKKADDRKPADDRKFSDRRRRDQDDRRLDEATNVIRQMPRGNAVDEIVERDDAPRFRQRPRHFEVYGDDDGPRVINEPPPRFGLFGD